MKIGFPAAGVYGDQKFCLSSDFTRSGLIGVYDSENGSVEVISKTELNKGLMETLQDLEVSKVITPELQVMALKVFREQGVDVYRAEGTMLSLNVELLKHGQLPSYSVVELFADSSSCSSSSCSSCSSTSCS